MTAKNPIRQSKLSRTLRDMLDAGLSIAEVRIDEKGATILTGAPGETRLEPEEAAREAVFRRLNERYGGEAEATTAHEPH